MTKADFYRWLADAVLVLHFSFVVFVVGGLVLTWIGFWRRWAWVRGFGFRAAHLLAMGIVLSEAIGGVICPLTDWEDRLRALAGSPTQSAGSFIHRWVHRVIFYEVNEGCLAIAYGVFFALIVATVWLVKPRWPWAKPPRPLPEQQGDRPTAEHDA
jgi:hypothetical protein